MRDLVYGWRVLSRSPLFSIVAIATLGVGIGANTAIFTVVDAVLLKPIAVRDPGGLVAVFVTDRNNPGRTPMSTHNFRDLREQADAFDGMAAIGVSPVAVSQPGDEPRQAAAQTVSASYFDVLGVSAMLGRTFAPDEDAPPGAHPVMVLSYGAWARRFGADRAIVGRHLVVNGRELTVVGVMPPSFKGTATLAAPDFWYPLSMYDAVQPGTLWAESRRWRWLTVIARLKPEASVASSQASARTVAKNLERAYPDVNAGRSFDVIPLTAALINPDQRGAYVRAAWLLVAIVGLVLLVACSNLANLLLARAAGRQKEIAVRLALGATRARLVRQLLTESLMLAGLGGAVGLLIALWLQSVLWSMRPAFLAQPGFELALDGSALAFAVTVSLTAGIGFGLVPALQSSHLDIERTLRVGGRLGGSVRHRLRQALVATELAFSVVALVVAALFLRSFLRAEMIDPGFDIEHVLAIGVNPSVAGYDNQRVRPWMQQTIERVTAVPGVRSATFSDRQPLNAGFGYTLNIDGAPPPPGTLGFFVQIATIGPRYFDTVGIPMVSGRDFSDADRQDTQLVAIINETMAQRFWPGQDPIGRTVTPVVGSTPIHIIGVARDSRYVTIGEDRQPFLYVPLEQQPRQWLWLFVRAVGRPDSVQTAVTAALRRADAQLPISDTATVGELVGAALWAPRTAALILTVFGGIALLLAAFGTYGVTAYSVAQRTQELGLRMALGASRRDVVRLIVGQGMAVAFVGAALGLMLALFAGRFLSALLYGINGADPIAFATVIAVLILVSFVACWLPARRAARLDPVIVLRGV
jgi:predicted permease